MSQIYDVFQCAASDSLDHVTAKQEDEFQMSSQNHPLKGSIQPRPILNQFWAQGSETFLYMRNKVKAWTS